MKSKFLDLVPKNLATNDGWVGVAWQLVTSDGVTDFTLFHQVPTEHEHLLPMPERADHVLPAVLLVAMQHAANLRVRGVVSPTLLDGLYTLQSVWHRWRPEKYHLVEILVDEEISLHPTPEPRGGLFAFSGGVDASFTLFRHLQQSVGRVSRRPAAALLVHGMDIPLNRNDSFDGAVSRAVRMLNGTQVPLIPIKTNSRQLDQDYEDSFGLQLISCFLLFQQHFAWGVKGSEEPFDALLFPWGSTPMTDGLLSTECISIIHDGADFDRTEKISWLAKHTEVTNDLRVCWAGQNLDKNCGQCEKCIRTMLNFWAIKRSIPSSFPIPLSPELVKTIIIRNEVQMRELRSLYRHALDYHKKNDPLLLALHSLFDKPTHFKRAKTILKSLLKV